MKKEFVPYEESLALKELGFDEPCLAGWSHPFEHNPEGYLNLDQEGEYDFGAPLYQQAFRWFFDKYHWTAFNYQMSSGGEMNYGFYVRTINGTDLAHAAQDSVDKAKLECLKKMINLAIKYEKENNNYE
jgi:hypothetical protein